MMIATTKTNVRKMIRYLFVALIICSLVGCDEVKPQSVPFDILGSNNENIEQVIKSINIELSVQLQQEAGKALKASVDIRNISETTLVIRNPTDSCELRILDREGWIINLPTRVARGLDNDKSFENRDELLKPGKEIKISLDVEQVISNAKEYYTSERSARKGNSVSVFPKFVTTSAGNYKLYAYCWLEAKTAEAASFSVATLQSKKVDVVVHDRH